MSNLQTLLEGDVIKFRTLIEMYFDRAKNDQRRHGNLVRLDSRAQGEQQDKLPSLGETLQTLQREVAAVWRPARMASVRALLPRVVRGAQGGRASSQHVRI